MLGTTHGGQGSTRGRCAFQEQRVQMCRPLRSARRAWVPTWVGWDTSGGGSAQGACVGCAFLCCFDPYAWTACERAWICLDAADGMCVQPEDSQDVCVLSMLWLVTFFQSADRCDTLALAVNGLQFCSGTSSFVRFLG
jgi:hypothetical protein